LHVLLQMSLSILKCLSITIVYLAIGVVFYHVAEEKDCEDSSAAGCRDGKESWTWIDALYFSVVTISTVGYGDLTPSTRGAKVFTMFYIFFGITVVFTGVAGAFSGLLARLEHTFLRLIDRFDDQGVLSGRQLGMSGKKVDLSGDGHADFVAPPHAFIFYGRPLAPWLVLVVAFQMLSASILIRVQSDVSYFDAFYHSYVTATTVGYGDISLSEQPARLYTAFHIIFSVSLRRLGWPRVRVNKPAERRAPTPIYLSEAVGRRLHRFNGY